MRVSLFNIFNKSEKFVKTGEYYANGDDNAYVEKVNRLIDNSPTGKVAVDLYLNYVLGLNTDDLTEDLAYDLLINNGFFCQFDVEYQNGNWAHVNPKILPFERCRVGKKDSKNYNGKILYKLDWQNQKEQVQIFDVYNANQKVIDAQIKKAGGIERYKGQVLYVNLYRNRVYPLSRIHAVMNDLDSESQAGFYRNQILRKGFFGKQLVITPSLIDSNIQQWIYDDKGKQIVNPLWRENQSERDNIKSKIEAFIGAENAGGAMLMEMPDFEGKIDDIFQIKTIKSEIDDKMFEYTENQTFKNILMVFNNIPIGLVKSPDGAMFGNSGESILQMQKMYQKNIMRDKFLLQKYVNFVKSKAGQSEIILTNLIEDDTNIDAGESTATQTD